MKRSSQALYYAYFPLTNFHRDLLKPLASSLLYSQIPNRNKQPDLLGKTNTEKMEGKALLLIRVPYLTDMVMLSSLQISRTGERVKELTNIICF
jgi:hypothetical protein